MQNGHKQTIGKEEEEHLQSGYLSLSSLKEIIYLGIHLLKSYSKLGHKCFQLPCLFDFIVGLYVIYFWYFTKSGVSVLFYVVLFFCFFYIYISGAVDRTKLPQGGIIKFSWILDLDNKGRTSLHAQRHKNPHKYTHSCSAAVANRIARRSQRDLCHINHRPEEGRSPECWAIPAWKKKKRGTVAV